MKIVKLGKENINQILDLESRGAPAENMYYRYNKEALEDIISRKQGEAFGIYDSEKLIGWASYRYAVNEDEIEEGVYEMSSLVVDPEYRRKGVGVALFNHRLETIMSKDDVKMIYATAHPANTPILCLYLNNGFIIYDFKKDKYGPGADRVYMKYVSKG